jgi:NAD(P)-dependent dehydrogenase (short-subunit alcohol dehydrogenase family)
VSESAAALRRTIARVGSLAGKVVVITGAAGGIGSATALVFARHGSKLFLVDRDEAGLTDSALAVEEAGAEVATHVADVTRSKDVQSYVAAALDRFGCIDAFFNNAGIEGAVAPIHEYPEDVFDQVIAVNLRGVFLGLRYVIPVMLKQGSGAIFNMGSIASAIGLPHSSAYIAAKHGVLGLTRSAASDVGRYGIRINAVMPGMIDTRMLRDLVLAIPATSRPVLPVRPQSLRRSGPVGRRRSARWSRSSAPTRRAS